LSHGNLNAIETRVVLVGSGAVLAFDEHILAERQRLRLGTAVRGLCGLLSGPTKAFRSPEFSRGRRIRLPLVRV